MLICRRPYVPLLLLLHCCGMRHCSALLLIVLRQQHCYCCHTGIVSSTLMASVLTVLLALVLNAAMGGSKSTDRFAKAVDQLDTMKQYAMASNVCRHAQVRDNGVVRSACVGVWGFWDLQLCRWGVTHSKASLTRT